PVRVPDLSRALAKPLEGHGGRRSFYTEVITPPGAQPDSAIDGLRKQVHARAERQGRNLLIILAELGNHGRKQERGRRKKPVPLDTAPVAYLHYIRKEGRTDGLRFLIIGQELSDFYPSGADPLELQKLITECNVLVGCQANTEENRLAYQKLLHDRM